MAKNKKLYKVNEGKMIDGVCAGIAEYFDADPTVIRLFGYYFVQWAEVEFLLILFA